MVFVGLEPSCLDEPRKQCQQECQNSSDSLEEAGGRRLPHRALGALLPGGGGARARPRSRPQRPRRGTAHTRARPPRTLRPAPHRARGAGPPGQPATQLALCRRTAHTDEQSDERGRATHPELPAGQDRAALQALLQERHGRQGLPAVTTTSRWELSIQQGKCSSKLSFCSQLLWAANRAHLSSSGC